MTDRIEEILAYWFADADGLTLTNAAMMGRIKHWFASDKAVDDHIRQTFGSDIEAAGRGELDSWAETPRGRLALIVLLDQFPRNVHRGSKASFAFDDKSRLLTEGGIAGGHVESYNLAHRVAFYLPLMHAEDRAVATRSRALYKELFDTKPSELEGAFSMVYDASERHFRIVDRFGRYPHRNDVLGRSTTTEEEAFMKEPGSSFDPQKR